MRTRFNFQTLKLVFISSALGVSMGAQAALFGDDEARRAILDLRQKLEATQQSVKTQIQTQIQTQVQAQAQVQAEEVAVLRRAILDLQNQIEALKADQSKMRGANEQLIKDLTELQIKQKDILQAVDSRLSRFEPVKVVLDGLEFQADPAEKKEFDTALAVFRTGDFGSSVQHAQLFAALPHQWLCRLQSFLDWQCAIRHQRLQRICRQFPKAAEHCTSTCACTRSHAGHFELFG